MSMENNIQYFKNDWNGAICMTKVLPSPYLQVDCMHFLNVLQLNTETEFQRQKVSSCGLFCCLFLVR